MLHSHSKLSASIPGTCLFGEADEDGESSKQLPPLTKLQCWGRGEFHAIKGRILLAGGPQLGELGQS